MNTEQSLRNILRKIIAVLVVGLAMPAILLWAGSMVSSIGMFSLGPDTGLRFTRGVAEFRHIYAYHIAPPMPSMQWHSSAVNKGWITPPPPRRSGFSWISFSSNHVMGISGPGSNATVSPAQYWLLRLPLWPLVLPLGIWLPFSIRRWRESRAQERRGFPVNVTRSEAMPAVKV